MSNDELDAHFRGIDARQRVRNLLWEIHTDSPEAAKVSPATIATLAELGLVYYGEGRKPTLTAEGFSSLTILE